MKAGFLKLSVAVFMGLVALWIFAPREVVELRSDFNPEELSGGVEAYLRAREAEYADITPGTQKRVVWAAQPEVQTDLAIVYIHGFSATSQELRPVPDRLAKALGANLFYTRLTGHGRSGEALALARAGDWIADSAEAMAIGQALGREVIVIGTSTGATLAAVIAHRPELRENLKGVVLVSANFGLKDPMAALLSWPLARHWVSFVGGEVRGFEPFNDEQARYWTTRYPTVSLVPMAALVDYTSALDYSAVETPGLFVYCEKDQVIAVDALKRVAQNWGGPVTLARREVGPEADPDCHVLAGDILAPGQNDAMVTLMSNWVKALPAPPEMNDR